MKITFLLFAFLMGCAHNYHGRQPDFHSEGAAAEKEYKHFKMYTMSLQRSTVGDEDGIRTKSLVPLIKDVSPEAHNKYRKMAIQRTVHTGLTAISWIVVGVWALSGADFPGGYALGAMGLVLGHSIYMDGKYQTIRNQYNRDLKDRLYHRKVVPQLGYSWNF